MILGFISTFAADFGTRSARVYYDMRSKRTHLETIFIYNLTQFIN